jgi:hypothetical protein
MVTCFDGMIQSTPVPFDLDSAERPCTRVCCGGFAADVGIGAVALLMAIRFALDGIIGQLSKNSDAPMKSVPGFRPSGHWPNTCTDHDLGTDN